MTGVVENIADPGSITMVEAVDGCRVLSDVPEVGVVQTQQGADQDLEDHSMGRNRERCLLCSLSFFRFYYVVDNLGNH
jgi:hypothetical protein